MLKAVGVLYRWTWHPPIVSESKILKESYTLSKSSFWVPASPPAVGVGRRITLATLLLLLNKEVVVVDEVVVDRGKDVVNATACWQHSKLNKSVVRAQENFIVAVCCQGYDCCAFITQ